MTNATEMLARLNAMLDAENEKDFPNLQLVNDLVLLIGGNCNPGARADDFTMAAFRVFPFLWRTDRVYAGCEERRDYAD